MLELFGHPFSSYTWKALIPLYENATPFEFRMVDDDHPENRQRLAMHSPQGKFPLLIDGDTAVFESSTIIEYLQQHFPGATQLIPTDADQALEVRMLDRFFDNYVMSPTQVVVGDFMREPGERDAWAVAQAKAMLERSYAWLDSRLQSRRYACGEAFSLADCAAAPSLFYADWVLEIPPQHRALRAYRAALLQRPSIRRCVDDARPFRHFFPPGAPDRD
ncbi:glutathione S-transferase family protein [Pseudomonas borbori]